MKKRCWMIAVLGCLGCCLAAGPALGQNDSEELVDLVEQELRNREMNLAAVRRQFETGRAEQEALHRAEQEVIQVRQKLLRLRGERPRGPLTLPIPHLQIREGDLATVSKALSDVLEGRSTSSSSGFPCWRRISPPSP